VNTSC